MRLVVQRHVLGKVGKQLGIDACRGLASTLNDFQLPGRRVLDQLAQEQART